MKMMRSTLIFCVWCVIVLATFTFTCNAAADPEEEGFLVTKENRRILVSTENGEIVAARVDTSSDSGYLLHFFTMDPNSLLLPLILHSDMVFYVHTGSGKLLWTDESELQTADLRRGDVYRLKTGAVFFIQSNLETETQRQRLRIISIFANSNTDEPSTGPYSSIRDMVLGFDKKVLQAAFEVPDDVIEELFNGTRPPAIIHGVSKGQERARDMENKFLRILLGRSTSYNVFELNKKGRKSSKKLFNVFKKDKDFKNCNGWSTTVTRKKLSVLKGTNIGVFMVNLTAGSMMGPHWNPEATEIAVVLQGRGMIRVVCSGNLNETGCSNISFEVEEGDIFAVPRFHPMAQMAFNNETFVFMGFSNSAKKNHPQFLAGQASVLRTLSKDVLATSFSVENTTMDLLLASQQDSVILGCISCAEEELRIVEKEREKEREEEEARKKEEEAREREEEEAKRQEEERRKREEEEEEEARKREEEEAAKRQEEEQRKREEEEARKREEEEAREREEEDARRQEEERKKREEEEARAKEEEEARKREEEEAKRQEEERKRQEEEEEEEARREEEEAREMEEERKKRQAEEASEREEAEAKRQEEERKRQEEEEEEQEEEQRRREEEEARQEEEEEEEEEERRRREESRRKEEKQRQEEEEWERRRQEEEEATRRREREEERRGRRSEEEMAAEEERRREEEEEREEEAAARQHDERERERERRARRLH